MTNLNDKFNLDNIKARITKEKDYRVSTINAMFKDLIEIYESRKNDEMFSKIIESILDTIIQKLNDYPEPQNASWDYFSACTDFILKQVLMDIKKESPENQEVNDIVNFLQSYIKSASQWKSKTEVYEGELFLEKDKYPTLYDEAQQRFEQLNAQNDISRGIAHEPIEQLSAKGLAILSHLYSEKDKSERQPLIASSVENLKHITRLMDNAAPGTNLVVIFQPAGAERLFSFGSGHKTVLKFERTQEGLKIITMDSTTANYSDTAMLVVDKTIKDNGSSLNREPTKVLLYIQEASAYAKEGRYGQKPDRQTDGYQCGIFAAKDARQLNRDSNFLSTTEIHTIPGTQYGPEYYKYVMPPSYLKSAQSREFAAKAAGAVGDVVVNRKGKTLKDVQEKHQVSGYVQHFSEKYRNAVLAYYEENRANPEKIRSEIARYDAGQMTAERLAAIYGPQQPQLQLDPLNDPFNLANTTQQLDLSSTLSSILSEAPLDKAEDTVAIQTNQDRAFAIDYGHKSKGKKSSHQAPVIEGDKLDNAPRVRR